MKEGSRIILIGSTLAERITQSGIADYSATKAALIAYAKGWAKNLAQRISPSTSYSLVQSILT